MKPNFCSNCYKTATEIKRRKINYKKAGYIMTRYYFHCDNCGCNFWYQIKDTP